MGIKKKIRTIRKRFAIELQTLPPSYSHLLQAKNKYTPPGMKHIPIHTSIWYFKNKVPHSLRGDNTMSADFFLDPCQ